MKNNLFDNQIKNGLQEQAALFQSTTDTDIAFEKVMLEAKERQKQHSLHQEKERVCAIQPKLEPKERSMNMKRFTIKKAVIATVAAVMVLGTLTVASGGVAGIRSSSSARLDYTKYTDLATAESRVGVTTNAPQSFSNGYTFKGITIKDMTYENEENAAIDSFQSVQVRYKSGSDDVSYEVLPRHILPVYNSSMEHFEKDGITYYYHAVRSKWVTPDYKPTAEEQAQVEAGTLNIGYGADSISYSDSMSLTWEKNGQMRQLFCMDVDLSKEDFINMALEIQ